MAASETLRVTLKLNLWKSRPQGEAYSMTLIQTPQEIFADARAVHSSSLEQLARGDIRDAAEKAWCAAKRATEALLLATTGEIPPTTVRVSGGLRALGRENEAARSLQERFGFTARYLHHDCFYNGHCEPLEDTERLIREAGQFIEDAEALAGL